MKFLSARELRNRPGYVRELVQTDDLVLTANGKPVAILLRVEEDGFEETARAIRQARAQLALSRMRKEAARGDRIPARSPARGERPEASAPACQRQWPAETPRPALPADPPTPVGCFPGYSRPPRPKRRTGRAT